MTFQMKPFVWSFFNPINDDELRAAFSHYDTDLVERAIVEWQFDFIRRAHHAYSSELYRHEILCRITFAQQEGCDSIEAFSEYQHERYNRWLERQIFPVHRDQYNRQDAMLQLMDLKRRQWRPLETSIQELVKLEFKRFDDFDAFGIDVYGLGDLFDAYWFDSVINTSDDVAAELRALPYADYLQTKHWKRVRAAMLLINRARCQSQLCQYDEGYWMDESFLNVHHLSYKNRGRERYADLRLLCKHCHRKEHFAEPTP